MRIDKHSTAHADCFKHVTVLFYADQSNKGEVCDEHRHHKALSVMQEDEPDATERTADTRRVYSACYIYRELGAARIATSQRRCGINTDVCRKHERTMNKW